MTIESDLMLCDDDDAGAVFCNDIHVMGDEDDGDALLLQTFHEFHQTLFFSSVLSARRFVEHEVLGIHRKCRGDGDSLLIAARQDARIFLGESFGVGILHSARHGFLKLCAAFPLMIGAEGDFLSDRRHEHLAIRLLEDVADEATALGWFFASHIFPMIEDLPRSWFLQSCQEAGHGGLAAAVSPCDGDEFPLVKREGNIFQYVRQAIRIAEGHMRQFKHPSLLLSQRNE